MDEEKVPVYTSFDFDHDWLLYEALVAQAARDDSPFWIADWSMKEESSTWQDDARVRIRRVDQVAVICGEHTDTATGVNVEIRLAREVGTPYFLLAGHQDNDRVKKPTAAHVDDDVYRWTWDNVAALVRGAR